MRNKRGLLMLEQVIKLIIAVLAILLIFYAAAMLFQSYFGKQKDLQAQGTLDRIIQVLNGLEEGRSERYTLLAPVNWYLVSFDAEHNLNDRFQKPGTLVQQNVICLCEKKCESKFCRTIPRPLKQGDQLTKIKIIVSDIWFTNVIDYYNVSKVEPTIIPAKLKEEEQASVTLAYEQMKTLDWNTELPKITEKYYNEYSLKEYVTNKEEFEKVVRAIIIQESTTVVDALGCDGEVGLMQLMPGTAKALGLNVPDYGTEDISQMQPCANPKRTAVSRCNKVHPENCNKAEDERFNAIKNIDGGTRYLAERIAEFKNIWLGIAAYNAGSGGVRENCVSLTITACPPEFQGRIYAEKIKAKMELL